MQDRIASPNAPAPWQRAGGRVLLAAVALAHLLGANELMVDRFGWGDERTAIRRIEVAFVRELQQSAPPVVAPAPRRTSSSRSSIPAVAAAASAPLSVPPEEAKPSDAIDAGPPVTAGIATLPDPIPLPAQVPSAAAAASATDAVEVAGSPPLSASAPAAAASEPAQPFDWPPSTRLTYVMEGHYRGAIAGHAQVEWLRTGTRYQVRLETSVPPVLSRRVVSEGELTDHGLSPRRFEGEQRALLRAPRRWSLQFGPERIVLTDGREVDMQPGAQDEASQFVQLTWLFTTQPQLLQVGKSLEIPLVLARKIDRWIYDIKEQQTLQLPFGKVETFYVKPRREAKGGDLTAEIWFAPSLMYLPVRILVRQDETNFVSLMLDRPPLQAAR